MSKPILYSNFLSACAWRVRIGLLQKGLEFETKFVDLLKGEHMSEKYKKINPCSKVPTLYIDGGIFTQTMSILEYLEDTRPQNPLLPKDPKKKAWARAIAESINADIQPLQNHFLLKKLGLKTEWGQEVILQGFDGIEGLLIKTAGKYCVGDQITLADCFLVPQVFKALRFKVDLEAFPIISRIYEELIKQDIFSKSHPNKQPDYFEL